jgi:hypothetical protein
MVQVEVQVDALYGASIGPRIVKKIIEHGILDVVLLSS